MTNERVLRGVKVHAYPNSIDMKESKEAHVGGLDRDGIEMWMAGPDYRLKIAMSDSRKLQDQKQTDELPTTLTLRSITRLRLEARLRLTSEWLRHGIASLSFSSLTPGALD